MKNNRFYSFDKKTETCADLYIYGDITSYEWDESDVSAFGFKQDLDALGEVSEINVHINSLRWFNISRLSYIQLIKTTQSNY